MSDSSSSAPGSPATSISIAPRRSLANYAADLEAVCAEIDNADEISPELVARFEDRQLALAHKVDNFICYLDAAKMLAGELDERAKRATAALKTMQALQQRLKDYVKFVIESVPGRTSLKGASEGTLAVQQNGGTPRLDVTIETHEIHWKHAISDEIAEAVPPEYKMDVSAVVLDTTRIRADLAIGIPIPWAVLTKGSHVRVR